MQWKTHMVYIMFWWGHPSSPSKQISLKKEKKHKQSSIGAFSEWGGGFRRQCPKLEVYAYIICIMYIYELKRFYTINASPVKYLFLSIYNQG